MKKITFIAIAIMAMLAVAPFKATAQSTIQPCIDMSTTVQREVIPDELYLRIVISEKDYKGKKTLEEMQKEMLEALKANNINIAENLTLNYMGSEVSYKTFSKKIKPKTEATYMLRLNDAATMQQVIASLEEKQISNIMLDRTKYTKEKELKNEMAIEAMQQAQAEAKVLAGAIGQEIGKAISINTHLGYASPQPRMYKALNYANVDHAIMEEAEEVPALNIGKITYTFNANVRFELK